jgi:hypothetical protein
MLECVMLNKRAAVTLFGVEGIACQAYDFQTKTVYWIGNAMQALSRSKAGRHSRANDVIEDYENTK